mmetsp:Transcript_10323/g.39079  ORF Transcript_10323/g.39079 Transcript_10323/m.39079 type:complete len:134 (-) Transcript_10323:31-432(-)
MAETKSVEPQITETEVIQKYQQLQNQAQAFANKIAEFEADLAEHEMVIKTLADLGEDRRAYRFINGVLVEKTVGAVLPDTENNAAQIRELIAKFKSELETTEAQAVAWKNKYNIKTQKEVMDERARAAAAAST